MSEAHDLREVDDFIASMDTAHETASDARGGSTVSPATTEPPSTPAKPSEAAAAATTETDQKKPTTPGSTPRLTPRRSDQSASSGDSSSRQGLPAIIGTNSDAAVAGAKASTASPPASPRVSNAAIANANALPPSTTAAASEPLGDLDALAELLRSDSEPLSVLPEKRESFADRASATESIGKPSALPPLLSSPHKSLSFEAPHGHSQSAGARRSTMLQKQGSLSLAGSRHNSVEGGELSARLLYSPRSATLLDKQNISPSRRRLTIGTHEISHHALERLGVNTDMLKKEKGMKKLGISDLDIERFEEIRRYSGVPNNLQPVSKVEFMFGFTREQLQRVKAINRLGTSEEEVQDEYSRRVSRLGVHDVPIAQN